MHSLFIHSKLSLISLYEFRILFERICLEIKDDHKVVLNADKVHIAM